MFLTILPIASLNAQVELANSDGGGQSSFNAGTNWAGNVVPAPGNGFVNSAAGRRLRTPAATGDYVFAGDSLTLSNSAQFFLKGAGTTTVNDLRLNGGRVYYGVDAGGNLSLAGNIDLQSGGGLFGTTAHENVANQNFNVSANIGGVGELWATLDLQLADFGVGPVNITLSGTNTYAGGTRLGGGSDASGPRNYHLGGLELIAQGSLGTGDVIVEGHDIISYTLNLQNANAIDAGASLLISGDASIMLGFVGTNSIGGLSFDGGSTFAAPGVYGAGTHPALFSGTGTLTVVPEASTLSLILGSLALSFTFLRARRKS